MQSVDAVYTGRILLNVKYDSLLQLCKYVIDFYLIIILSWQHA